MANPTCKVCFGTGWQPMRAGTDWVKWPCQACIKREQDETNKKKA